MLERLQINNTIFDFGWQFFLLPGDGCRVVEVAKSKQMNARG
jgi:hypothetical protein